MSFVAADADISILLCFSHDKVRGNDEGTESIYNEIY